MTNSPFAHELSPALSILWALFLSLPLASAEQAESIRAVVPRATQQIKIDGDLQEYAAAFAAPLEYFHPDLKNRAGQFFFLWDDEAFYVGVRALDEKPYSQEHPLWEGDAVEWYFDTRRDQTFMNREWGKGSLHCFFTPMHLAEFDSRFCLRPGYEEAIPEIGIEVAGRRTKEGWEAEFKLPWENFPEFEPKVGEVLGIDAELSYSDGGPRSGRSFLFGNPLSVWQPANLAQVELVEKFAKQHWQSCGQVMMPLRVDVPWMQQTRPQIEALVALPPNHSKDVAKVIFQTYDLHGKISGEHVASEEQQLDSAGKFRRLVARWPTSQSLPGRFHVQAIAYDDEGNELTRVAPRMVSVHMQQGY